MCIRDRSWGHLGPSWGRFGAIVGHHVAVFRTSWHFPSGGITIGLTTLKTIPQVEIRALGHLEAVFPHTHASETRVRNMKPDTKDRRPQIQSSLIFEGRPISKLRGMEQDAVVIFGGRPSSMKMWSPDDIGRESWVWGEQDAL